MASIGVRDYFTIMITVLAALSDLTISNGSMSKVFFGDLHQFRDGDILLAVAIPVGNTDDEDETKCANELSYLGIQMVEQVNMVIEKINADDNLLRGVRLGTIMINTCFSAAHTLQKLVLDVLRTHIIEEGCGYNCTGKNEKRILAGVVGASRSSVSMQIARILQVYQIPQVSYWSTNPDLSDKARFKYFFRTVPPDTHQAFAIAAFVRQSNWTYVSIVYDNRPYGVQGYAELVEHLGHYDVCVGLAIPLDEGKTVEDLTSVVRQLMTRENARAVILFMASDNIKKLMKASYLVPGALESLLWIGSDGWAGLLPHDPTDNSYIHSLDGSVGFHPKFFPMDGLEDRMGNLTLADYQGDNTSLHPWWEHYVSISKNCSLNTDASGQRACDINETINDFKTIKTSIGDSVMTFVHALDAYHRDVCEGQPGLCRELAVTAGTNKVASGLYEYLKNVSFETSDGRTFKFDENQDGPPVYDVQVYDRSKADPKWLINGWIDAGTYDDGSVTWIIREPENVRSTLSTCSKPCVQGQAKILEEQKCCWFCQNCTQSQFVVNGTNCEECPRGYLTNEQQDGCIPMPIRQMEYNSGYSIGMVVLGTFGLLCTTFVASVYLKYKDTAIVKASGKELCFFVLFGVFVTLLNCFAVTATPSALSCAISRVILSIGPACMYAGMLMKTFRVVFIFQSKGILSGRTKAYLEPVPLLMVTLCVCAVQVVILVILLTVNAPGKEVQYFEREAFLSCRHLLDEKIFVGLAYPFLIIIICTILASINRNVPTGFRETLLVGFTMYTTCVTWIAFLPLFFTNSTDIPKKLTTISVALTVSAITVLFCLFAPRCYTMLFYPEVNTPESVMAPGGSFSTSKRRNTVASTGGIDNHDMLCEIGEDTKSRSAPS